MRTAQPLAAAAAAAAPAPPGRTHLPLGSAPGRPAHPRPHPRAPRARARASGPGSAPRPARLLESGKGPRPSFPIGSLGPRGPGLAKFGPAAALGLDRGAGERRGSSPLQGPGEAGTSATFTEKGVSGFVLPHLTLGGLCLQEGLRATQWEEVSAKDLGEEKGAARSFRSGPRDPSTPHPPGRREPLRAGPGPPAAREAGGRFPGT